MSKLAVEQTVVVAELLVRARHREFAVDRAGADRAQHVAGFGLRPDAAEHPRVVFMFPRAACAS